MATVKAAYADVVCAAITETSSGISRGLRRKRHHHGSMPPSRAYKQRNGASSSKHRKQRASRKNASAAAWRAGAWRGACSIMCWRQRRHRRQQRCWLATRSWRGSIRQRMASSAAAASISAAAAWHRGKQPGAEKISLNARSAASGARSISERKS